MDVCEPIVYKMWEPRHQTIEYASTSSYGGPSLMFIDAYVYFYVCFSSD
jgi:hypothetical protein